MDYIRTPDGQFLDHWATENTMRELVNVLTNGKGSTTTKSSGTTDTSILKEILHIMKLSLVSGKSSEAIDNEIIKVLEDTKDEISKRNLDNLEDLLKAANNKQDDAAKETKFQNINTNKNHKELNFSLNRGFTSLTSSIGRFASDENISMAEMVAMPLKLLSDVLVDLGSLPGKIIGGFVGAGASILTYLIGAYEKFGNVVSDLSKIGGGLNMTLDKFKNDAAMLGVGAEDLAKIMYENGSAMAALGHTTQDGIDSFADLGHQVNTLIGNFNNYGYKNAEVLEIMAQEIELRRKSGQDAATIQANLASSMNDLLFETSAVAAITGQNKRELINARAERAKDAVIAAHRLSLTEEEMKKFDAVAEVATARFGQFGKVIADAVQYGQATGMGLEANAELLKLAALAPQELQPKIMEFAKTLDDQIKNPAISREQMSEAIVKLQDDLGEAFKNTDWSSTASISIYADGDVARLANVLLEAAVAFQGIDYDPVVNSFDRLAAAIEDSEIQKLPSSVEKMSRAIEASFFLSTLELAQKIPGLGDLMTETNIADLPDFITDVFTNEDGSIKTISDVFGSDDNNEYQSAIDAAGAYNNSVQTKTSQTDEFEKQFGGDLSGLYNDNNTPVYIPTEPIQRSSVIDRIKAGFNDGTFSTTPDANYNAIPGQRNISAFNKDGSTKPLEVLIEELIGSTNEVVRQQKKTIETIERQ